MQPAQEPRPAIETFTPARPCRCGYDGQGEHLCHIGREIGRRCPNVAIGRLVPTMGALAGMQMKFSCAVGYCCAGHWQQIGREEELTEIPRVDPPSLNQDIP